jgi:hypothetical protein
MAVIGQLPQQEHLHMHIKHGARFTKASGLSAVLGLWLLISSLILSPPDTLALNGGLAGAAITLIGIARFSARETSLAAWTIALLGSWVAVAPWILAEAGTELRAWHCVIVGVLLAITETFGVVFDTMRYQWDTGAAALQTPPRAQKELEATRPRQQGNVRHPTQFPVRRRIDSMHEKHGTVCVLDDRASDAAKECLANRAATKTADHEQVCTQSGGGL